MQRHTAHTCAPGFGARYTEARVRTQHTRARAMADSRICNFGAPAAGSCCCRRTPLQNECRRSACVTHLALGSVFNGSSSRIQRISTCKLQSSCKSLGLGAAEEGKSSWQDKLESTSTRKGDILEGEADTTWRDRIVDEEGNIDNIEQELTRSPCEEEAASEQWLGDQGGRPDAVICPKDMLARDHQDQSQQQRMHDNSSAASTFNPSFKNCSQTMEHPSSALIVPTLSSTAIKLWPGAKDGFKEGDKGEAVVGTVHSYRKGEVLPTQFQERQKYGSIEATCDDGFDFGRSKAHEHGGGKTMEEDKLQQEEEVVFQEDEGRRPDDYQRRAKLFGKSGEQFVAQKQRNQRKSVEKM